MHDSTRLIKNMIWGIIELFLVFDAGIGICSGKGTVFDYLVVIICGIQIVLTLVYHIIRKKNK